MSESGSLLVGDYMDDLSDNDSADNPKEAKASTESSFSIVDYEHDANEHYDDGDAEENVGRVCITTVETTPPAPATPTSSLSFSLSPSHAINLLPPPATAQPDEKLVIKLKKYHDIRSTGKTINQQLKSSKAFRNPDILEKLVVYCDILEIGSNYPKHLFDPEGYTESDFYDSLADAQNKCAEKKEAEKQGRTKVDFVPPTRPSVTKVVQIIKGDGSAPAKNKRSKWDSMEPDDQSKKSKTET